MKFLIYLMCLLLVSCGGFKTYDEISKEDRMNLSDTNVHLEVKKEVLPNGLTLLVVENHQVPIFSYYTFYKVGAKYEQGGITGASHFLEHLMFKGAKKYKAGDFEKIIEGNGGSSNAYTTFDQTVYYETLPSKNLEKIIDVEADRMQHLTLEEKSFESERQVILEERKMRYENRPAGKLYLKMMQEVFEGTPYGGSVIGKIKDLKSITREQIYNYFKSYYAPNNAVIVIVGDVDFDEVKDQIAKKFGPIPSSKELAKLKLGKDQPKLYKTKTLRNKIINLFGTSKNPLFMVAFDGEPIGSRRAYVMDILSGIIGSGDSSYLTQKYVKGKRNLLSNIYAANYNLEGNGVFFLGGELLKETGIKQFRKDLYKTFPKMCDEAITTRNVQKVLNQYLNNLFSGLETNSGVASFIGEQEAFFGDYNRYKKDLEIYSSITVKELQEECERTFKNPKSLFLTVWEKNAGAKK